jgi:hypothetical protein
MFDINFIPDDLDAWLANNSSQKSNPWSVTPMQNDVLAPTSPVSSKPTASDLRGDENPWLLSNAFGTEIIVIRP